MSPNLRIAFRFLTAKKRSMLMSLSCIILGVGLFVVTQATTSGFEEFFIQTILGTNGAIKIEDKIQDTTKSLNAAAGTNSSSEFLISNREGRKYIEGIEEPKLLVQALSNFSNVVAVSEVVTGSVLVKSAFKNETAKVFGINVDDHVEVSDLAKQIISGSMSEFSSSPAGALLGRALATRMNMDVGDSFILDSNNQQRRYRISALYETGVTDIDRVRIYLNMGEARSLLKKTTGASFLQISLYDRDRAPMDCIQIEETLRHGAASWQEREKSWLGVFRALKLSSGITVSVFTLIAGLAMFNTLAMLVMEKTKDIAILRSMGYTRDDISKIFLWQAVIVLAIGSIGGAIMGAIITYTVSRTPLTITGIFKTETFIVSWSIWHYVSAVLISIIMVMVASMIPSRRAARLEPGDVIRGTAL